MFRRFLVRGLFILPVGTAAVFVLLTTVIRYGFVHGEEFAPDTFQRRSYRYYELPLIRLKITPVKRTVHRPSLEEMLVNKSYVPKKEPPDRWDLVAAYRGVSPWRQGDAQLLCDYLDAEDTTDNFRNYWEKWTEDHPELAKVLWSEIAQLARRDLYALIPPLFERAVAHDDPAQLRQDLQGILAAQYELLAEAEQVCGRLETAARYSAEAQRYESQSTTSRVEPEAGFGEWDQPADVPAEEMPLVPAERAP
jgi:hypothetical protein